MSENDKLSFSHLQCSQLPVSLDLGDGTLISPLYYSLKPCLSYIYLACCEEKVENGLGVWEQLQKHAGVCTGHLAGLSWQDRASIYLQLVQGSTKSWFWWQKLFINFVLQSLCVLFHILLWSCTELFKRSLGRLASYWDLISIQRCHDDIWTYLVLFLHDDSHWH